jgi:hypothetical protein
VICVRISSHRAFPVVDALLPETAGNGAGEKRKERKISFLGNRTRDGRPRAHRKSTLAGGACRCAMRSVEITRDILLFTNRGDASNDPKSSHDDRVFCTPPFEQKRSRQVHLNDCLMYSRTMISSENQAFSQYQI